MSDIAPRNIKQKTFAVVRPVKCHCPRVWVSCEGRNSGRRYKLPAATDGSSSPFLMPHSRLHLRAKTNNANCSSRVFFLGPCENGSNSTNTTFVPWCHAKSDKRWRYCLQIQKRHMVFIVPHRAMFKLGAKNLFLLCLLIKEKSAVYSADRCNFSEPVTDLFQEWK